MNEINVMLLFFAMGIILWLWIQNMLLRVRQRALQDFASILHDLFRGTIPAESASRSPQTGGWGWILFLIIALYLMIQLLFALNN